MDNICELVKMLPREPGTCEIFEKSGFWTNGDLILCPSETEASVVANFIQDAFKVSVMTGYFDPVEDDGNDERDECTGFWYVDWE